MSSFGFSPSTQRAMSRRKTLKQVQETGHNERGLRRTLGAFDLILFGVGSSVGAGIFVLIGIGARVAGPAIGVSFLLCGMTCILTSLAYAEFASMIPASGSAFTYVYVAFGEFFAWMIGFLLILGYGFTASVTARAWADYTGNFLVHILPGRLRFIEEFTEFPLFGSSVNYTCSPLSIAIVSVSTFVLLRGSKESTTFNNLVTMANILILALVVVAGIVSGSVEVENMQPFAPHKLSGVVQGSGLVFFAFIGFDQVASLSEEVLDPESNMPIGIVGSLIVSTAIYVSVSFAVVGMASGRFLGETVPVVNALLANACCTHAEQVAVANVDECLADCPNFQKPLLRVVAHIVSGGAIFGLMSSTFTSLMGQPRIFHRMALDGLWFKAFAHIDPDTRVPSKGIKATGAACAVLACFVPLEALANLISLGTLMVFTFVDGGVILLRIRSVSEAAVSSTTQTTLENHSQKRDLAILTDRVVMLLLVFTTTILAASVSFQSFNSQFLLIGLLLIALIAGWTIVRLPDQWTLPSTQSTHPHPATRFECPWVPVVPLGGVACNTFMMGSLPLSAWFCLSIWLALGATVYFAYGIHHSSLGKNIFESETTPLAESSSCDDYSSTLNVSIHGMQHKE